MICPADSTLAVSADEDTTKLLKGSERGDDDLVTYCLLTIKDWEIASQVCLGQAVLDLSSGLQPLTLPTPLTLYDFKLRVMALVSSKFFR